MICGTTIGGRSLQLHQHLPVAHLRVGVDLLQVHDRARRHTGSLQYVQPVLGGLLPEGLLQQGCKLPVPGLPVAVGQEPGVAD